MLPPFIIEQIKEREEEQERVRRPQPCVEVPLKPRRDSAPPMVEEDGDRGVVIIDLISD